MYVMFLRGGIRSVKVSFKHKKNPGNGHSILVLQAIVTWRTSTRNWRNWGTFCILCVLVFFFDKTNSFKLPLSWRSLIFANVGCVSCVNQGKGPEFGKGAHFRKPARGSNFFGGRNVFAYNWKLPAYNWVFLLTVVFGSILLKAPAFLLTVRAFVAYNLSLFYLQKAYVYLSPLKDCEQQSSAVSKRAPNCK